MRHLDDIGTEEGNLDRQEQGSKGQELPARRVPQRLGDGDEQDRVEDEGGRYRYAVDIGEPRAS